MAYQLYPINFSNEWGIIDKPWPNDFQEAKLRILMLGGDNFDSHHLGIEYQCGSILERWFNGENPTVKSDNALVRKLAYPGMGISRLWAWYQATKQYFQPHIVILSIDALIVKNMPLAWFNETGFGLDHPAGDYLFWDDNSQSVQSVKKSAEWPLHQIATKEIYHWPSNGKDFVEMLLKNDKVIESVKQIYTHIIDEIKQTGTTPILLIEGLGTVENNDGTRQIVNPASDTGVAIRRQLAKFAEKLNVLLIDPYEHLAQNQSTNPIYDDGLWTYTGHRLVAEAIYHTLDTQNLIPTYPDKE